MHHKKTTLYAIPAHHKQSLLTKAQGFAYNIISTQTIFVGLSCSTATAFGAFIGISEATITLQNALIVSNDPLLNLLTIIM